MRIIKITVRFITASLLVISSTSSCVDLTPEPLSFYAPENTFMDKEGLDALLVTSRKQIKWEWFGDAFNAGFNGKARFSGIVFEVWIDVIVQA